jgi:hypothetical protein
VAGSLRAEGLEGPLRPWNAYYREVAEPLAAGHSPARAIDLIFGAIAEHARQRRFRGSLFLNAAADHPVRRLVASSACEGRQAAASAAADLVAPVWIRGSGELLEHFGCGRSGGGGPVTRLRSTTTFEVHGSPS